MKLNVNKAIFLEQHTAGVDCILRDDQGRVVTAATKLEEQIGNPLEIELVALFGEIQICVQLDIHTLKVESDSLIIQAINERENSCMQYSNFNT